MQNKNKTFESYGCLIREPRLLGAGVTERFDRRQVKATKAELQNITADEGEDLAVKLEMLKQLERQKRTKDSTEAIKRLKKSIEKKYEIELSDSQMEGMINDLIEKHDKEVGTAIQIDDDRFVLVHASENATKLVLQHYGLKGKNLNSERLKEIFGEAGFEIDEEGIEEGDDSYSRVKTYSKDKIPTARPFSKVVEDGWDVEVPAKGAASVKAPEKAKIIAAPGVEALLAKGSAHNKYEKLLDQVYGAAESADEAVSSEVKITSWPQFLREFKKVGSKIESIKKVIRRGKDITEKVQGSLRGKGNADIRVGDVITFAGAPEKTSESVAHKFFRNPNEANRRNFSSAEFAEKVRASKLSEGEKTELIEAAIKLDVTVTSRRVKESGKGRGVFLERQAAKSANGSKDVQKLFAERIGAELELEDFYKPTPEKAAANKGKIQNILSGESSVFMLRIDRMKAGGKFDSRVEETRGAAWIEDVDAPQKLRDAKDYTYKYSEISNRAQKAEILKKYLKGRVVNPDNYQIAQVEIPNCENPAIVIKKLEAAPVVAEAPKQTVKVSLTAVQYFKNVPGGWTLIFRVPDWFKPNSEFNYLADPAIVDLRESEYLSARERLDPKPHKFLAERVDEVLGWRYGSFVSHGAGSPERGVIKSLENYLENESSVDEKPNKKIITEIAADLEKRMKLAAAGDKETAFTFLARVKLKADWQKEWMDKGADERMLKLAELLYDWDCKDFDKLEVKMKREEEAFYLAELIKYNDDLAGRKISEVGGAKLLALLKKYKVDTNLDAKKAIESALYDEDKINAARPPIFIGDAIFIPPTFDKKDQPKIVVWENQASITKEMLKVHSPLSLAIEVISLLTGYVGYIRTGLGRADALGKYLEMAEGSDTAKAKFREIFKNQKSFDAFRNFVIKGLVPETGGNKISLPLNEIQILIPGWRLLVDFFGCKDCGCVTEAGVKYGGDSSAPGGPGAIDLTQ